MNRQPLDTREKLDRFCRQFPRPDGRDGPLTGMLVGVCVVVAILVPLLMTCGGPR